MRLDINVSLVMDPTLLEGRTEQNIDSNRILWSFKKWVWLPVSICSRHILALNPSSLRFSPESRPKTLERLDRI